MSETEGYHPVTLETIGNGAATEMFEEELTKVLENIMDPNTDGKAIREITVKVRAKPHKDRSGAQFTIDVTSKLAPITGVTDQMFFGRENGKLTAYESDLRQANLFKTNSESDANIRGVK